MEDSWVCLHVLTYNAISHVTQTENGQQKSDLPPMGHTHCFCFTVYSFLKKTCRIAHLKTGRMESDNAHV